jgi:hypothetical protein
MLTHLENRIYYTLASKGSAKPKRKVYIVQFLTYERHPHPHPPKKEENKKKQKKNV